MKKMIKDRLTRKTKHQQMKEVKKYRPVIRCMFNFNINVTKCPVKSKRKKLASNFGVSVCVRVRISVNVYVSLRRRGGHFMNFILRISRNLW